MPSIFDDEVKREAAATFRVAARSRARALGESPLGQVLQAAAEEHQRIEQEEHRRPTPRDFLLFGLKAIRVLSGEGRSE